MQSLFLIEYQQLSKLWSEINKYETVLIAIKFDPLIGNRLVNERNGFALELYRFRNIIPVKKYNFPWDFLFRTVRKRIPSIWFASILEDVWIRSEFCEANNRLLSQHKSFAFQNKNCFSKEITGENIKPKSNPKYINNQTIFRKS